MKITPHPDSAQVKIPPPLAVAFVITLSVLLMFVLPSPFLPENFRWFPGAGLSISGVGLVVWSALLFKKRKTALAPWHPTSVLLKEGPYRFSRNPIYLGGLLLTLGVILLVNNAFALLLPVPLFIFLDAYVVEKEEAYLLRKFGSAYQNYLNSTRRWL